MDSINLHKYVALPLLIAAALCTPQLAFAADAGQALKQAWSCAKTSVSSAGAVAEDLYNKGETIASLSATAGKCLALASADQVSFAITMGALTAIKVASPSSLPTGQCLYTIKSTLARPFAQGVAAVLPSTGPTNQLKALAASDTASDTLWEQIAFLPLPIMTIAADVECGCEFIDKGLSLADMSAFATAIGEVSASCSGFLDAAGLGFINDFGGATIGLAGDIYSAAGGAWADMQSIPEPAPDPAVYFGFWGAFLPAMSEQYALNPAINLGLGHWQNASGSWVTDGGYQSSWQVDMTLMTNQCIYYYQHHRFSDEHAHRKCDEYRDRAAAEAVTIGKQLQAIAALPKLLDASIHSEIETNWTWRLPYFKDAIDSYAKTDNKWSTGAAIEGPFRNVLGRATKSKDDNLPWEYSSSGIYAAAREILPNVGYNPEQAAALAVASIGAGLTKPLRAQWEYHASNARDFWLDKWFPIPTFGGKYGCPTDADLGAECIRQAVEAFDKVCLMPLAAAHTDTATAWIFIGHAAKARVQCLSWLGLLIDRANQLAQTPAVIGDNLSVACGGFLARSEQAVNCQRLFMAAAKSCALNTLKAHKGLAQAQACVTSAVTGVRQRMLIGARPDPKVTPNAPAGTLNVPSQLNLPPAMTTPAPAPSATRVVPSAVRVSPNLIRVRLVCKAGEVLVTDRDGEQHCEVKRQPN